MEQAIELDPDFARAHAALALIHAEAFRFDWTDTPEQTRLLALKIGQRAVDLNEYSPQAHWILGYVYLFLFEDHDNAIKYARRATELAPSDADGYTVLAVTHAFGNDPSQAKQIIQQLMQQHPRYSALVPSVLGLANLRLKQYEESLQAYNKSLLINPSRIQGNVYKTIVLYRMGNRDDAEWQLQQLYTLHPNFDIAIWAHRQPFKNKLFRQHLVDDLMTLRSTR